MFEGKEKKGKCLPGSQMVFDFYDGKFVGENEVLQ